MSKGIFHWQIQAVAGGDPEKLGDLLNLGKIDRIELKVANGTYKWPIGAAWISRLRVRWPGKIFGWTFCYGYSPGVEARNLAEQVRDLGLDGGVFDVEGTFECQANAAANAKLECGMYRSITDKPLGFCSWALWTGSTGAAWHSLAVGKAFMAGCDFGMPMMYWGSKVDSDPMVSANYFRASMDQWRASITDKPLVPVGRAYIGDGGYPVAAQMTNFEAAVQRAGCPGISWWSLQHAIGLAYPWAEIVRQGPWAGATPLTLEQRVTRLEEAAWAKGWIL
jgi:hypothetical protein